MNVFDPTGEKARLARNERQYQVACAVGMAMTVVLLLTWR